jgi:hypothetical protein
MILMVRAALLAALGFSANADTLQCRDNMPLSFSWRISNSSANWDMHSRSGPARAASAIGRDGRHAGRPS